MPNHFIWYELLTPDADAAARFYGDVVGWTVQAGNTPGKDYRHLIAPDGEPIGGMLQLTDQMVAGGARPVWLGYVDVPDVDAAVRTIVAEGGKTQMPPTTLDGVGRIAMVTDPQGAPFYVMTPTPPPERAGARSTAFARGAVGHCGWNELTTTDPRSAFGFYTRHFGWTDGGSMPMGEMGDYQFINDEEGMIGAMMSSTATDRPSLWTYYFRVPDIDLAKTKIESHHGSILDGPHEVPGGDYIVVGTDPQGAMFALVGARCA